MIPPKITNTADLKNIIQYVPFTVIVNFDYSQWSKLLADITEAKFVLKKSNANADSEYLQKELADITIDDGNKTFTINILASDFGSLKPGDYTARLGILFDGETQYRDTGEITSGIITIKESWFDYVEPAPI